MRGLFMVLGLGAFKAFYTRYFLSNPKRRNVVSPEAVSRVRLTPEGSGFIYEYGWPKRKKQKPKAPDAKK